MNTSEVLNKAADLIEERGWAAGGGWITSVTVDQVTPVCLEGGVMGAMGLVAPPRLSNADLVGLWTCPAYKAVSDYLGLDSTPRTDVDGEPTEPLWRWNDHTSRSASEVVEVLRATALIEQARENAGTTPAAEREGVTVK